MTPGLKPYPKAHYLILLGIVIFNVTVLRHSDWKYVTLVAWLIGSLSYNHWVYRHNMRKIREYYGEERKKIDETRYT